MRPPSRRGKTGGKRALLRENLLQEEKDGGGDTSPGDRPFPDRKRPSVGKSVQPQTNPVNFSIGLGFVKAVTGTETIMQSNPHQRMLHQHGICGPMTKRTDEAGAEYNFRAMDTHRVVTEAAPEASLWRTNAH